MSVCLYVCVSVCLCVSVSVCYSLMFEVIVVYLKLASGEDENENNRENAWAVHVLNVCHARCVPQIAFRGIRKRKQSCTCIHRAFSRFKTCQTLCFKGPLLNVSINSKK